MLSKEIVGYYYFSQNSLYVVSIYIPSFLNVKSCFLRNWQNKWSFCFAWFGKLLNFTKTYISM